MALQRRPGSAASPAAARRLQRSRPTTTTSTYILPASFSKHTCSSVTKNSNHEHDAWPEEVIASEVTGKWAHNLRPSHQQHHARPPSASGSRRQRTIDAAAQIQERLWEEQSRSPQLPARNGTHRNAQHVYSNGVHSVPQSPAHASPLPLRFEQQHSQQPPHHRSQRSLQHSHASNAVQHTAYAYNSGATPHVNGMSTGNSHTASSRSFASNYSSADREHAPVRSNAVSVEQLVHLFTAQRHLPPLNMLLHRSAAAVDSAELTEYLQTLPTLHTVTRDLHVLQQERIQPFNDIASLLDAVRHLQEQHRQDVDRVREYLVDHAQLIDNTPTSSLPAHQLESLLDAGSNRLASQRSQQCIYHLRYAIDECGGPFPSFQMLLDAVALQYRASKQRIQHIHTYLTSANCYLLALMHYTIIQNQYRSTQNWLTTNECEKLYYDSELHTRLLSTLRQLQAERVICASTDELLQRVQQHGADQHQPHTNHNQAHVQQSPSHSTLRPSSAALAGSTRPAFTEVTVTRPHTIHSQPHSNQHGYNHASVPNGTAHLHHQNGHALVVEELHGDPPEHAPTESLVSTHAAPAVDSHSSDDDDDYAEQQRARAKEMAREAFARELAASQAKEAERQQALAKAEAEQQRQRLVAQAVEEQRAQDEMAAQERQRLQLVADLQAAEAAAKAKDQQLAAKQADAEAKKQVDAVAALERAKLAEAAAAEHAAAENKRQAELAAAKAEEQQRADDDAQRKKQADEAEAARVKQQQEEAAKRVADEKSAKDAADAKQREADAVAAQKAKEAEELKKKQEADKAAAAAPQPVDVPEDQRCELCDEVLATIFCGECDMQFCTENDCDASMHKPAKMAGHKRILRT